MKKVICITIILILISCDDEVSNKKDILVIPTSEAKFLKIFRYDDKGGVEIVITGLKNVIFRDSKEIWLDKIRVLYLSKEGDKDVSIQLKADKGKVNYKTLNCEVWSNAVVLRENEVRIETERLFWNHSEKKVYSKDEGKVVIYKRNKPNDPNDMSMVKSVGKNLVADSNLKHIYLDSAITSPPSSINDGL